MLKMIKTLETLEKNNNEYQNEKFKIENNDDKSQTILLAGIQKTL